MSKCCCSPKKPLSFDYLYPDMTVGSKFHYAEKALNETKCYKKAGETI